MQTQSNIEEIVKKICMSRNLKEDMQTFCTVIISKTKISQFTIHANYLPTMHLLQQLYILQPYFFPFLVSLTFSEASKYSINSYCHRLFEYLINTKRQERLIRVHLKIHGVYSHKVLSSYWWLNKRIRFCNDYNTVAQKANPIPR